jgi:hypothetical protein
VWLPADEAPDAAAAADDPAVRAAIEQLEGRVVRIRARLRRRER